MIFKTKKLGLRMFWRGDWEARLGPMMLTILYNGHGDGGVFLRMGHRERHLRWP
uniref:hypothetical protein n=1 Tax=Methylobacterium sp. B34 TaxID=95563 RepID=UPI0003457B46|nr:hypothetical protein [Methylobacterium sp. B34]